MDGWMDGWIDEEVREGGGQIMEVREGGGQLMLEIDSMMRRKDGGVGNDSTMRRKDGGVGNYAGN
jgi:hypothetical protein